MTKEEEERSGKASFHVLGGTDLRRADGGEVLSVLAQPKRLGLLLYLTMARPGAYHSRERLLGLFWTDRDDRSGRDNLNRSISFLRSGLGANLIMSRGEQQLGVNLDRLWCDAVAFREAIEGDRYADALDLYRGELAHGLSVTDAQGFDHWLAGARVSFLRSALSAAWSLVDQLVAEGNPRAAVTKARWAAERAPLNEDGHRRLIRTLEQAGDRAGAVQVFESFAERLLAELGLDPSSDTLALINQIRRGRSRSPAPQEDTGEPPVLDPPTVSSPTSSRAPDPPFSPAPAPRRESEATPRAGARVPMRPHQDPSRCIAVLPFSNLTNGGDDGYFSEGVTADIVTCIAKIRSLSVVSTNAVRHYAARQPDLRGIGDDLGVGVVLQGSVRRSEDRVRVVAQLFDADSGDYIWAETYDRQMEDIFRVQSEVAERIAAAMEATLSPTEQEQLSRKPTESLTAYDFYLRARFAWNKRSVPALLKSIDYLEQAVAEDPGFAIAHAGLADSYVTLGIYGGASPEKTMRSARAAAEKALKIEPGLAEAFAARACTRAVYEWDWSSAEADFLRALALAPDYATAHHWYASNCLIPLGRFREAHEHLETALALDPYSLPITVTFGVLSYFRRNFDEAAAECWRVTEMDENFGFAYMFLGLSLDAEGHSDDAVVALRAAVRLSGRSPESVGALAHACAVAGHVDEARELIEELESRGRDEYISPTALAIARLGLGEHEEAMGHLEEALSVRASDLIWINHRATFDPLREMPRFEALLGRMGFPP